MEKSYMRKYTHWTKEETEELALEAWNEGISQEQINKLVDSMPERLRAVIAMDGRMTGY
jgi:DNA-directed RNA polymerase subunit F